MSESLQITSTTNRGDGSGLARAILFGGVASGGAMLLLSAAIVAATLLRTPPEPIAHNPPTPPQAFVPETTGGNDSSASSDPANGGNTSGGNAATTGVSQSGVGTTGPSSVDSGSNTATSEAAVLGKVLPPVNLEVELGEGVDLLAARPERVLMGQAQFPRPGVMELGSAGKIDAVFAGAPLGKMLIDARVQRTAGIGGVMFHVPVEPGRTITLAIDLPRPPSVDPASGLFVIGGQMLHRASYPRAVLGSRLADGQPHDVKIAVLDRRLVVQMDGETLVDWSGDFALLGGVAREGGKLSVSNNSSTIRFERLRTYPIEDYTISPTQAAVVETSRLVGNPPPPPVGPSGATALQAPSGPLDQLDIQTAATVDLLGGIGPTMRSGQISTLGSTLTTSPEGICRAEFVYRLPEAYIVEARVKRNSPLQSLAFSLNVGGRPCAVLIDGFPNNPGGPYTGIDLVGGSRLSENESKVKGPHLEDGKQADVRIVVFPNRVVTQIDGQTIFDWQGDAARLSQAVEYRFSSPFHLGLSSYQAGYTVEKLVVHRIAGVSKKGTALAAGTGLRVGNTTVPAGPPLNLLQQSLVRPRQGEIAWQGSNLVTSSTAPCRLEFEPVLPASYVLEATITRTSHLESIAFSIRVGGNPCAIVIDGWPRANTPPSSGLDEVDGLRTIDSPLGVKGQQLQKDKPADVKIAVLGNRVLATIDGRTLVDWTGDPSRLSQNRFTRVGSDSDRVGIVTQTAGYRIEKLLLYPVTESLAGTSSPPGPSTSPPAEPSRSLSSLLAKQPVPADDAQQPVREKMSSVFGDAIEKAKKPDERAKLARQFADVAKSERDATTRYVLLQAARKMAVAGLEPALAIELADSLCEQFEVEALALKMGTLQDAAAAAGTNTEVHKRLGELAAALTEESLDSERYDVADEASKLAFDAAARSRDAELRRQTKELRDETMAEKAAWETAEAALAKLQSDPNDAAAHLAAGRYYALSRGDWTKGLAHLVAGNDEALAAAAKAETGAEGAAGQLDAADKWYDAAAAAAAADKPVLQRHALELYEAALPQLTGLDQIKATRRRDDLKAAVAEAEKAQPGAARTAARRSRGPAAMEPGLIARTYRGDPPRNPTHLLSIVTSSDEYFGPAMSNVQNILGNFSPTYYQPVVFGYVVLNQPGTVEFELMNCVCVVDGQQVGDARTADTVNVEKKLSRGKHTVAFRRATNTLSGPQFKVKLQGSSENVLFHSEQDLKIELAKPFRLPQGGTGTSIVVFRTPQASSE